MKIDGKSLFKKIMFWSMILFAAMFVFRLGYGYVAKQTSPTDYFSDFFDSLSEVRKNYASEKKTGGRSSAVQVTHNMASNQKFEKSGIVQSKSPEYEKDEKAVRNEVKDFNAQIQYEQNLGLKGNRELHLLIGVNPDSFDSLYNKICKIGYTSRMQVTKVDKTNEYRKLNAQKASLEAGLISLNELKAKNGQISDFVQLNDKILGIESELQGLGVELGNFDTENEYCTVKFSLYEGTVKHISFMHRVKVAFEWTVKYYLILFAGMLFASLAALVIVSIYLQISKSITRKEN